MAYKKDQFHYLSTLCNPIIVKHRYYFQQNVINIISSSPSFLFRSQKPPASQVRRFATSVFVSCTPAQNEMPASPSLGFVSGYKKEQTPSFALLLTLVQHYFSLKNQYYSRIGMQSLHHYPETANHWTFYIVRAFCSKNKN